MRNSDCRRKRVLFVFPTEWDRRQLEVCRQDWEEEYDILFAEPSDEECRADIDIVGYIERLARDRAGEIDGVMSTSDYPGAPVAAAVATALGLPGPRPEAVLTAGHKFYSRLVQRRAVPEAVPGFDLVDPAHPDIVPSTGFPCFLKPVKGSFSNLARRVDSLDELAEFLAQPAVRELIEWVMRPFDALVDRYTGFEVGGGYFIAEELLSGQQVTVEGYATGGKVEILGITDSVMHPERCSFARFDYPSLLPAAALQRMEEITGRAALALGLERTLFNVEMTWDPRSQRLGILEVNPRAAGQFADLYQKVDGLHSYAVALALATGDRPRRRSGAGRHAAAASFPLRVFEPVRVVRAPTPGDVTAAEALCPDTQVWIECKDGEILADFARNEDGASLRYAVVNLGGPDRGALQRRLEAVVERLGFALAPQATLSGHSMGGGGSAGWASR